MTPYSIVLTSCNRFDLLRATVSSLLAHLDRRPEKFIVIEDSGNAAVRDVLAGIGCDAEIIVNNPQIGQAASIDKAYAHVQTPHVFHCEDDWEFLRGGFIDESERVLEAYPMVSVVSLLGRSTFPVNDFEAREAGGASFFMMDSNAHWKWHGYIYNPGLRRMSDYRRMGPFARIGGEREVSCAFHEAGFRLAHLEETAVRHLGDGRHVIDPLAAHHPLWNRLKYWFRFRVMRHLLYRLRRFIAPLSGGAG